MQKIGKHPPEGDDFDDHKEWHIEEAKGEYEKHIAAGFNYAIPPNGPGHNYQMDPASRENLNGLLTQKANGKGNPHKNYYRSSANEKVVMSDKQFEDFALAAGDYYADLTRYLHDLKDDINAAQSMDAVKAIDIHAGWPGNPALYKEK